MSTVQLSACIPVNRTVCSLCGLELSTPPPAWPFSSSLPCVAQDGEGDETCAASEVGPEELHDRLLACGAEGSLVSLQWVRNHYRWIVWKLAAYERRGPECLVGRCLTAEGVLDQLKYR